MSSPKILSVGLGNMGAALAQTLAKTNSNSTINVWNRTRDRPQVNKLIESGARFEPNLEEALRAAEVIIICLLDYDSIYSVLNPASSSLAGKVVINLTNGTPRQANEAQEWMKRSGVKLYFDGAVMVTPQLVGTPQSFLLYSGETEETFRSAISDLVSPLGASLYVGEDVTTAATNDLAALAAMYGMFSGAFIGIGLLQRQLSKSSKDASKTTSRPVSQVIVPLLKALVPYVTLIASAVDGEAWDDSQGNPLGMQLAGVRNILQACKEEGVDGAGLEPLASLMQRVVDERGGDGGVAEISRLIVE